MTTRNAAFFRVRGGASTFIATFGAAIAYGAVYESAAAQTRDSLEVDVGACVGLDSPEERFACYERSVEAARRARGESAQAVTEPPPSIEPKPSERPAAAAAASSSSTRPAASSAAVVEREIPVRVDDDFGKRQPRRKVEERPELRSTIVALRETVPNTYLITLENGQVWRQMEGSRYPIHVGDSVRIYPSRWGGSYRLSVENVHGFIQVERVR
ncbi:MAG: hypothetical protein C0P79_001585 [Gammaproteobacteria bacterium]